MLSRERNIRGKGEEERKVKGFKCKKFEKLLKNYIVPV
jgi:hypothetical protein